MSLTPLSGHRVGKVGRPECACRVDRRLGIVGSVSPNRHSEGLAYAMRPKGKGEEPLKSVHSIYVWVMVGARLDHANLRHLQATSRG